MNYTNTKTLIGSIDKILYTNPNGFKLFRFIPRDGGMTIVKGNFVELTIIPGLELELKGKFTYSNKYQNWQFETEHYKQLIDNKKNTINYLITALGIPRLVANKIYKHAGKNTIDWLKEDPSRIKEVPDLSQDEIDRYHTTVKSKIPRLEAVIYLQKYGLTSQKIQKLLDIFGAKSKFIIEQNPYLLVDLGVADFVKIDQVTQSEEHGLNTDERIRSLLVYLTKDLANKDGHSYITLEDLKGKLKSFIDKNSLTIDIDNYRLLDTLVLLNSAEKLHLEKTSNSVNIYPDFSYKAEVKIASKIKSLLSQTPKVQTKNLDKYLESLETNLVEGQKQAFKKLTNSNLLVITGGPGTGKTYLTSRIAQFFQKYYGDCLLVAPTGMAAQKLTTESGLEAGTLHRKLRWVNNYDDGDQLDQDSRSWQYNEDRPHPTKFVICDEVSMIDQYTFSSMLSAFQDDIVLILVGDKDQLESVGPGNILSDLIASKQVPSIELKEEFRFENAGIIDLAQSVNNGKVVSRNFLKNLPNVNFIETRSEEETLETLSSEVSRAAKNLGTSQKFSKLQVIAPVYKGLLGVSNLNKILQDLLNKTASLNSVPLINYDLQENDKVVITKNNYDLNILNGENGYITKIEEIDSTKYIRLNLTSYSKNVSLTDADIVSKLDLAYCLTVHKVQGNEYDTVILPLTTSYGFMLKRKLLYTALTRCKRNLVIIGSYDAFVKATVEHFNWTRNTNLTMRIDK